MAANPQALLSDASCLNCYGATTIAQLFRLSILVKILTNLNPMAATDPQSLIEYGKCFACYGMSTADVMELALLDQINAAGGGGGGGGTSNNGGVVDPEGVVSGTQWQWYTNTANQTYWQKQSPGTGTTGWQQVV